MYNTFTAIEIHTEERSINYRCVSSFVFWLFIPNRYNVLYWSVFINILRSDYFVSQSSKNNVFPNNILIINVFVPNCEVLLVLYCIWACLVDICFTLDFLQINKYKAVKSEDLDENGLNEMILSRKTFWFNDKAVWEVCTVTIFCWK